MLVIRLARTGRHKYPTYRLVAADKRRPTSGKFVSVLGHYNPHTKELVIDKEQVQKYLQNGAQPSNTVIKLLRAEKLAVPAWAKVQTKNRPPKKTPEAKPEASATAPAEAGQAVAETATDQGEAVEPTAADVSDVETAATEQAQTEGTEQAAETAGDAAIEAAEQEAS